MVPNSRMKIAKPMRFWTTHASSSVSPAFLIASSRTNDSALATVRLSTVMWAHPADNNPATAARAGYTNFESSHVHPIDLTPSGNLLLVVNTPDGLLVETHTDPDAAWCDREQAIGPAEFRALVRETEAIAALRPRERTAPASAAPAATVN